MTTRVTQNVHQQQALVIPAPLIGLDKIIPVVDTIINYDYACSIDTLKDKTSIHLLLNLSVCFIPLAALDKSNCGKYIYGPSQDLGSLLQTGVTFTNGPCRKFNAETDHIPMAQWYNEIN